MSPTIVMIISLLGMGGAAAAMLHHLLRLNVPGNELGPLNLIAIILGLAMCDRYADATGDVWALPTAVVLALMVPAVWMTLRRRARLATRKKAEAVPEPVSRPAGSA